MVCEVGGSLAQDTVQGQRFTFSIGASAWVGMGFLYLSLYRDLGDSSLSVTTVEQLTFPLVPVGILAGSIVVHEFAHAAAMLANSIRVGKISLEIWGGYTQAADGSPSFFQLPAGKVFSIYVVGPLSNLLVAAGLWYFALDTPSLGELSGPYVSRMDFWLSMALKINLLLAVFNILPLIPLDGGHVLRSILMGISGSAVLGTIAAGLFSLIVGTAYVRYIAIAALQSGWDVLLSHVFLTIFVGAVVLMSCIVMMGAVAERHDFEPRVVHPFQRIAAIVVVGLPVATLYMLHVQDGWMHLPTLSEITDLVFG